MAEGFLGIDVLTYDSTSGMMSPVYFSQPVLLNVRVSLGGGYVRMTQQFLNGTKIRTTLKQVSCERVPQGVRRELLRDTCLQPPLPENLPKPHPREPPAGWIQEDMRSTNVLVENRSRLLDIVLEHRRRLRVHGDDALLVSLPTGSQETEAQINILNFERQQFRYPQSGGVEDFYHCSIPHSSGTADIRRCQKVLYFFLRQEGR